MAVAELSPKSMTPVFIDPAPRTWSAKEKTLLARLGIDERRMTRHQFDQLSDENLFQDQKVMLLDGVVYQESPMNAPHATGIRRVTRVLETVFKEGYDVRCQLPVDMDLYTVPNPDVSIVTGHYLDYERENPTYALLVVEISDTTLAADLGLKASLYAMGKIQDYWVVDLNEPKLVVFRDPIDDSTAPNGMRYRTRTAYKRSDKVSPLAMPDAVIAVSDLLP
jgi:Uma2 family endonuclease